MEVIVTVQAEPLDPTAIATALTAGRADVGAVVTFTGLVRGDDDLIALTLEHYPAMTERALTAIAAEAETRWPLLGGIVVHRVGRRRGPEPAPRALLMVGHVRPQVGQLGLMEGELRLALALPGALAVEVGGAREGPWN